MPSLIGNKPNQVPTNADLGNLAYQDASNIAGNVGVGGTLAVTGQSSFTGNVGVGTSSPTAKFQVGWTNDQFQLTNPATGTKRLGASYTGYVSGNIYSCVDLNSAGSSGGSISFSTTPSGGSLTTRATIDESGNLGLGVTPSAWATVKAIQVSYASIYGNGTSDAAFSQNAYYNAGWKYIGSVGAAAQFQFDNGAFKFFTAPSGTAGTAITFTQAMTLQLSGGLSLGNTTDLGAGNFYANGNVVSKGDLFEAQPAPTALTATGTLTIAQIQTNIITVTSATAVTLTLPTGTLTDAGILAGVLPVDTGFDWFIINTGSSAGAVTMAAGTGHTYVGNATVAINTSASFRTRKTAANTYITYRIA